MIELNVRTIKYSVNTRSQRRIALGDIIKHLEMIRNAEIECLENRPANLRFSHDYYIGETAVEDIDWAIDNLVNAYKTKQRTLELEKGDFIPF